MGPIRIDFMVRNKGNKVADVNIVSCDANLWPLSLVDFEELSHLPPSADSEADALLRREGREDHVGTLGEGGRDQIAVGKNFLPPQIFEP